MLRIWSEVWLWKRPIPSPSSNSLRGQHNQQDQGGEQLNHHREKTGNNIFIRETVKGHYFTPAKCKSAICISTKAPSLASSLHLPCESHYLHSIQHNIGSTFKYWIGRKIFHYDCSHHLHTILHSRDSFFDNSFVRNTLTICKLFSIEEKTF